MKKIIIVGRGFPGSVTAKKLERKFEVIVPSLMKWLIEK